MGTFAIIGSPKPVALPNPVSFLDESQGNEISWRSPDVVDFPLFAVSLHQILDAIHSIVWNDLTFGPFKNLHSVV